MDVFSHTLWAAIIAKLINFKYKIKIRVWLTALSGAFPDVFAFAPLFLFLLYQLIFGTLDMSELPHPEDFEPPQADTYFMFRLTNFLYNISHSLIIFLIVSLVIFFIFRRPVWELGGWLLHIIVDIPTHSFRFYPTPFIWPLSDFKINGLSWASPWFLVINYLMICTAWLLIRYARSTSRHRKS